MERVIDRFDRYMVLRNLNDNKVTVHLGLSVGLIGKSRKPGRDLSRGLTELILNHYKEINRKWLLLGEGEMLVKNTSKEELTMAERERLGILEETIQVLKKELADKQKMNEFMMEQIRELKEENRELRQDLHGLEKQMAG